MNQTTKYKRIKWISWILYLIIFLMMLNLAVVLPVRRSMFYICKNTGSRRGYCEWLSGLYRTGQWYRQSHLEAFMRQSYPAEVTNRWSSYSGTGMSIFGKPVLWGHGRPGRILGVSEEILNQYVDNLSPENRLDLYRLFASDDQEKIQEAILLMHNDQ